ncbi:hypothetical protein BU52_14430 [Streptomyces toyocaensis]|uniref:Uncharacterized protein n=1 Tax=Streptomyces toyocaensis TaxID=55952 RepID=A0A081XST4_STRTO|nr:hypothetical protein BU52_14430 [Streptomyces toyocaensis]
MRFQPDRLRHDPAARLVGGGAYVPVLGDREVAAVGRPEGEHALAPVGQGQFGAGRPGGERRQIGTAREQRRVEGVLGAARRPGGVGRRRHVQERTGGGLQQHAVHAFGELHAVGAEPLAQTLQRGGAVDQAAAVPVELALVGEQSDDRDAGVRCERQRSVVLEQDDRLLGGLPRERPVFGGVEGLLPGAGVRARVELARPTASTCGLPPAPSRSTWSPEKTASSR